MSEVRTSGGVSKVREGDPTLSTNGLMEPWCKRGCRDVDLLVPLLVPFARNNGMVAREPLGPASSTCIYGVLLLLCIIICIICT